MTKIVAMEEDMIHLGSTLSAYLHKGDILYLNGSLGAGKTTFVKGLAKGLGISEPIKSPTYTLIHEYTGKSPLAHIDLYRLETLDAILSINFAEYFDDYITAIEWAERAETLLPKDALTIKFSSNLQSREVEICARGIYYCSLLEQWEKSFETSSN